jgi:hypothetical protein
MRMQSTDTDFKTEAALIALLRRAKPYQKFAQVRSLSQMTLSLSRRAIARKNGYRKEAELRELFVYYQYGEDLADRFKQYQKKRSNEES